MAIHGLLIAYNVHSRDLLTLAVVKYIGNKAQHELAQDAEGRGDRYADTRSEVQITPRVNKNITSRDDSSRKGEREKRQYCVVCFLAFDFHVLRLSRIKIIITNLCKLPIISEQSKVASSIICFNCKCDGERTLCTLSRHLPRAGNSWRQVLARDSGERQGRFGTRCRA